LYQPVAKGKVEKRCSFANSGRASGKSSSALIVRFQNLDRAIPVGQIHFTFTAAKDAIHLAGTERTSHT
jgi:hypothetical protein